MSVRHMADVFAAIVPDLPTTAGGTVKSSTLKLVLLSIADHMNDIDMAAYPGMKRLENKTGLSHSGLIKAIDALKLDGIIQVKVASSHIGTNLYTMDLERYLPPKPESKTIISVFQREEDEQEDALADGVVHTVDGGSTQGGLGVVHGEYHNQNLTINKTATIARARHALGVDLSTPRYDKLVKFLMAKEKEGQPVEQYGSWMKKDPFNSPKVAQIANNPGIVVVTWEAAFKDFIKPIPSDGGGMYV